MNGFIYQKKNTVKNLLKNNGDFKEILDKIIDFCNENYDKIGGNKCRVLKKNNYINYDNVYEFIKCNLMRNCSK